METLELLAGLNREKRLGDMDVVWKQRFEAWVEKALVKWERSETNVGVFFFCMLAAGRWLIVEPGADVGTHPQIVKLAPEAGHAARRHRRSGTPREGAPH